MHASTHFRLFFCKKKNKVGRRGIRSSRHHVESVDAVNGPWHDCLDPKETGCATNGPLWWSERTEMVKWPFALLELSVERCSSPPTSERDPTPPFETSVVMT